MHLKDLTKQSRFSGPLHILSTCIIDTRGVPTPVCLFELTSCCYVHHKIHQGRVVTVFVVVNLIKMSGSKRDVQVRRNYQKSKHCSTKEKTLQAMLPYIRLFYVQFIEPLASKKKPKTASPELLSAASEIEL